MCITLLSISPSTSPTTPFIADFKTRLAEIKKQTQEKSESNIFGIWGSVFVQAVGSENIKNLPRVNAKNLNLDNENMFHSNGVDPNKMDKPAVWTMDKAGRPVIVLKLKVLYAKTGKKVTGIAGAILKLYILNGYGGKRCREVLICCMTSLNIEESDGQTYNRFLFGAGRMRKAQMNAVGALLKGKTTVSLIDNDFKLQLIKA